MKDRYWATVCERGIRQTPSLPERQKYQEWGCIYGRQRHMVPPPEADIRNH